MPRHYQLSLFLSITVILILSSCARQPWTNQLVDEQENKARKIITIMRERDQQCGTTLDTEALISLSTPMKNQTIRGNLQLMTPSHLKFVMLNPLGQPVYAATSDGKLFQTINTGTRQYTVGRIASFAMRNDLPPDLLLLSPLNTLSGRFFYSDESIVAIHNDQKNQGLWIRLKTSEYGSSQFLLIDPELQQIKTMVIMDKNDNRIASITYDQQQQTSECSQPGKIVITDLAYDSKISIVLSDILKPPPWRTNNFVLKIPRGYLIRKIL